MLGVDAAEADVVDALVRDHRLPNLKRLRDGGLHGRLTSPAGLYAGGVWPTFYTGRSVPSHGIYHNKLWHAERMRVDVASDDWLAARPFWERLPDSDLRVCIVDVPMVLGPPRPVNGLYLGGWSTHDLISEGSWPPELWRFCEREFGGPAMPPEHFGRQSEQSLEPTATPARVCDEAAWSRQASSCCSGSPGIWAASSSAQRIAAATISGTEHSLRTERAIRPPPSPVLI